MLSAWVFDYEFCDGIRGWEELAVWHVVCQDQVGKRKGK